MLHKSMQTQCFSEGKAEPAGWQDAIMLSQSLKTSIIPLQCIMIRFLQASNFANANRICALFSYVMETLFNVNYPQGP